MDIKDFQGLTKFKILIPLFYLCSWTCAIVGPLYFEVAYRRFCLLILLYTDIKCLILLTIMTIVTIKSRDVFRRVKEESTILESSSNRETMNIEGDIFYGFIIPSYKEDIELLSETLDVLAAHKRAKTQYLIFMAMEAHEENSNLKAIELQKRFKEKFRLVDYTVHQMREFEQKGKASNVSWCAEHLEPIFSKNMIDPDAVFLTILDADSWAPNVYFEIMDEHIIANMDQRHNFIYQPPQIFTRNNLDVPVFTRVYDMMHSFAHCANLYSIFKVTFPLSNYTLSYNLIKRIGFWDTCPDAIGEDFHTTQKAFWKTGGNIVCVPIYAPFNQVNICTGNGYVEDVLARFWQAERHAQGCSDLAWNFKLLFTTKFKPMNFVVFFQIFEIFVLPAVLPWVFLSLNFQANILFNGATRPSDLGSPIIESVFFNILTILSTVGYIVFEVFRRKANKIIYKRENESLLRVIEYPIMFIINLFFMSVPTFILAAFGSLAANREYIVAEKKGATKNN